MRLEYRSAFLLASLVLSTSFHASAKTSFDSPASRISSQAIAYPSINEAATAALRASVALSTTKEYGGCVFQNDSAFYYTEPVSVGKEGEFRAVCMAPPDWPFVGIFHTHPDANKDSKYISGEDIEIANKLEVVSFVGSILSNKIIKFIPGVTKSECPNSGSLICAPAAKRSAGVFVSDLRPEN